MSLCLVEIHGDYEGDIDIIKVLPDNATNGDIIKAVFPNFDYEDKTEYFGRVRNLDDHFIKADINWWNDLYEGGRL